MLIEPRVGQNIPLCGRKEKQRLGALLDCKYTTQNRRLQVFCAKF